MTPQLLVAALDACKQMLERANSAHVLPFASLFVKRVQGEPSILFLMSTLSRSIGQPDGVEPKCARLNTKGHSPAEVRQHIQQMFYDLAPVNDKLKRARWVGFAAGAAAGLGLTPDYMVSHENGVQDFNFIRAIAHNPGAPDHHLAHIYLGYLQGWLWTFGHASIDDFRVMNNPDSKRAAVA